MPIYYNNIFLYSYQNHAGCLCTDITMAQFFFYCICGKDTAIIFIITKSG